MSGPASITIQVVFSEGGGHLSLTARDCTWAEALPMVEYFADSVHKRAQVEAREQAEGIERDET